MSCLLSCIVRKVRISSLRFLLAHISNLPPKDLGCLEFSFMDVPFPYTRVVFNVRISHAEIIYINLYFSPVFSKMYSIETSLTDALKKKSGDSMVK